MDFANLKREKNFLKKTTILLAWDLSVVSSKSNIFCVSLKIYSRKQFKTKSYAKIILNAKIRRIKLN